MIDINFLAALLPSLLVMVGVWVNLNGEIVKVKSRLKHLEMDREETKNFIREVREALEHIRIMLATPKK